MKTYEPEKFDSFAEEYEKFVSYFLGNPYLGWDDLSGDNAIDIGCGAGQATKIISTKFKKVVGIDLSSELINLAKQKHSNDNINYIVEDILNFNDQEHYDFVYSHTMMHHMSNYESALIHIKNLVKKGGKIFIVDNVADKYRTPPKWAYTIPAKIEFLPNIIKYGFNKALFLLKFWHNKKWLAHLASDKYLNNEEFNNIYLRVFPGAEIINMGFGNGMKWVKE